MAETTQRADKVTAKPLLDTEVANRQRDPFETSYLGVLRTNDPLLLERGESNWQIYRDLRRDGKVFSALQKRVLALISRPWQVEPVTDGEKGTADAEIVSDILKACAFDQVCRDLMDALLAGFSVSEIVWTVRDGRIVPDRIVKRAPRRFVYVQEDENLPPALRLLTTQAMTRGEALPERKFVVHRVNPEDDNPYGMGLGLQLYWPVFFKRKGIVAWNKLNDRFGTPTPWGKYPRNASAQEKGTLFDALKAFSNDGVVMTPEGTMIELLESKLSGNITTQQALCEYMDDWIDSVVLGTEARSKSGGALAAASEERQDVRLDLVQADSDLLSDTLNSTLLRWVCEYNGLEPCLLYRDFKKEEDKKAQSETDKNVSEMGFELNEDAVRARYGEGWGKKAPPAALDSKPLDAAAAARIEKPAQFAEGGVDAGDVQQNFATKLEAATADSVSAWMAHIADLVARAPDLEALQNELLNAYGSLQADELARVMELGYTAAMLAGMADARES